MVDLSLLGISSSGNPSVCRSRYAAVKDCAFYQADVKGNSGTRWFLTSVLSTLSSVVDVHGLFIHFYESITPQRCLVFRSATNHTEMAHEKRFTIIEHYFVSGIPLLRICSGIQ